MNKKDIKRLYPNTWAVFKTCSWYDNNMSDWMYLICSGYVALPFKEIKEPTWCICEKYLTDPESFSESSLSVYMEGTRVAQFGATTWNLVYTEGTQGKNPEDILFAECHELVNKAKRTRVRLKKRAEKAKVRNELLQLFKDKQ